MPNSVNSFDYREHFTSGDIVGASGVAHVGEHGWSYDQNLEAQNIPSEPNHPGIVRLRQMGAGASSPYPAYARLSPGTADTTVAHSGDLLRFRSVLRVSEPNGDGDFTDEGIYTGFGVKPIAYPGFADMGPDCIFFSFRPSVNPKWQAGCQATDPFTGITAATMVTSAGPDLALNTWYVLEAVNTLGSWEFFVDGASIGVVSTDVPSAPLTPQFRMRTENVHETGYVIDLDCDEFTYRLAMTNPGLNDW